jgi:hypothetical protein
MTAPDVPVRSPSDPDPPAITQSVAAVCAGFGLLATLGMGWMLARSTAGLPPIPTPGPARRPTPR